MYIRKKIIDTIKEAIEKAMNDGVVPAFEIKEIGIEMPHLEKFGDFSTSFSMKHARFAKVSPAELSKRLLPYLMKYDKLFENITIEGPGFINFYLKKEAILSVLNEIFNEGPLYGRNKTGEGQKVQVEFVSINPTGPMHVAHGRWAALGDSLAKLFEFSGFQVEREYYVNDFGNQMDLFTLSVEARCLELKGLSNNFPENGYHGEYIYDIAKEILGNLGDDILNLEEDERRRHIREFAYTMMMANIMNVMEKSGVYFDNYFKESSLHISGEINETLKILKQNGNVYENDGAVWLKTTAYGDDKDRVLIKSDGSPTYYLSDIAYHKNKIERGFNKLITLLGADHHGHIKRMQAGIASLGYSPDILEILIGQMVNLLRDGQPLRMSKRAGKLVTFEELIDEVGKDAARFTFIDRSLNSNVDFDIELVKKTTSENPAYYVQYVYARICSIYRQGGKIAEGLFETLKSEDIDLSSLTRDEEFNIVKKLEVFPDVVLESVTKREVHLVSNYAKELASMFHSYYNGNRILGDDNKLQTARLKLVEAVRIVIGNCCEIMGISKPEKM